MLGKLYRIGATLLLLFALGVPQGIAQGTAFGALAYSPSKGVDGYSFNYRTKSAAQARALQQCRARASGCRVVAFVRGGCIALAVGRVSGWGAASGASRPQAKSRAVSSCRKYGVGGCRVQRAVCSG